MAENLTEDEVFEQRIQDLEQKIRLFRERIKNGMSDPKTFMTLSDIEREWCNLSNSTEVTYSDIIKDIAASVDEKAIVKQKKTNSETKE